MTSRDLPKTTVESPEKAMRRMAQAVGIEDLSSVVQFLMNPRFELVVRLENGDVIGGRLVVGERIGNIRVAT